MAGDQIHAFGLDGVSAAQNGVDVGDGGGFGDAIGRNLGEGVAVDFKAAAALGGDLLKLGEDPVSGGGDALARRQIRFHAGKGVAGAETNQGLNRFFDILGLNSLEGTGNGRVWRGCAHGRRMEQKVWLSRGYRGQDRDRESDCARQNPAGEVHSVFS